MRAALLRGVRELLARQPRRVFAAALDALPQALAVAGEAAEALAAGDEGDSTGARPALDAALEFGALLSSFAPADIAATRARVLRALLQLLCAAASPLPTGAADACLAQLRATLQSRGVASWDALRDAAAPAPDAPGSSDTDDDDADDHAPPSTSDEAAACGAALLAHAWLCHDSVVRAPPLDAAEALRRAAPHAEALLRSRSHPQAALFGARLAHAASRRLIAAGTHVGDEAALSGLLLALAESLGDSPLPSVRVHGYDALLACLDAHLPWARFEARKTLLCRVRDPSVAALLFRRLKDDAAATWGQPPFGAAPAARLLTTWLSQAAADSEDELADSADAVTGALNALRFMLLRDAATGANASGLRERAQLLALQRNVLEPLARASERAGSEAAAEHSDECDPSTLLARQTLHEVVTRTKEAAVAATPPETAGECSVSPRAAAAAKAQERSGIMRRGFFG